MRILIGIDTFGLIGGSERYAIGVSRELAASGHQVGVLCGAAEEASTKELPVTVLPTYSAERAASSELDRLSRAVLDFRPEVLYLLSARGRAAVRRMTALAKKVPVVRYVQDHTLFCPGLNKMHVEGSVCTEPFGSACLKHYFFQQGCTAFRREVHRSALDAFGGMWKWKKDLDLARRASALFVASRYMRDELLKVGMDPKRVELVPYFTRSCTEAAPMTPPDPATRAFVEGSGVPVIFAPARLALPDKGVDYLITALGKLRTPFRAVVAGSGPAEPWLREKARAEGLGEKLHFAGWQNAACIEWLYSRATVVAFPSIWDEPFGLVGIEAMSHSKPVVAFAVGGVPDWLSPEETGFLHPRRDADGFAASLQRLLDDSNLAARMGAAGKKKVAEHFSPAGHVKTLEKLFSRLALVG
ncbi:MAG: glycosyltransferase family 4 protein [Planctomycetota bacterium]